MGPGGVRAFSRPYETLRTFVRFDPKGKLSAVTKLTGKDDLIREYLEKKIPVSVIARLLNVNRLTVRNYIRTRKLQKPAAEKL
jgi:hypothetical protein